MVGEEGRGGEDGMEGKDGEARVVDVGFGRSLDGWMEASAASLTT